MRKKPWPLLLATLLAILVSACTPASPPVEQKVEKVYRFSDTYDATMINGHNETDSLLQDILLYTHSSLYRRVPSEDGKAAIYIGDLADGDPVTLDDGHTWHIKLRKEAKWHNDEPINADTIIYSFKMLIDPLLVNSMANFLYDREIKIENGFEYYTQAQEGKSKVDWEDVGIKKVDDHTIEIITTQRYLPEDVKRHFTDRSLFPVYEPLYEAGMNDSRTSTTYGTSLDEYMGCGPYFFDTWNQDANRVYVKNPDHWLADYFKIDRVEVRITPDRNARVQMWENGEIDVMGLDSATLDTYRDDPRTLSYTGTVIQHIDINSLHTKNPILGTMDFRRAMYWAIDRATIADLVGSKPAPYYINHQAGAFSAKGVPYRLTDEAKALVPPNNGYDPEKAREYFEAALAEVGQTCATIELMYNDSNVGRKVIGEYLQQALPEVFGPDKFTLNLRAVPTASYDAFTDFKKTGPDCFEMAFSGWSATLSRVYPYASLQYFVDAYEARPNSFISEDFDRQFAALQAEEVRLNTDLMYEMTAELEAIYLRDVINVPLYDTVYYTMYSERMVLPCPEYVPGLGFGSMFADIKD